LPLFVRLWGWFCEKGIGLLSIFIFENQVFQI